MTGRDLGSATQTGLVLVVILLAVKDKVTASHKNLEASDPGFLKWFAGGAAGATAT